MATITINPLQITSVDVATQRPLPKGYVLVAIGDGKSIWMSPREFFDSFIKPLMTK